MTFRMASRVGPTGKVYATDLQPEMLATLDAKRRRQNIPNIEVVLGTATEARLPDATIDLVMLVDVYHEFRHPKAMLRSLRRSLKSEGRLVLLEYRKEDPNRPIAETHRMSVAEITTELEGAGFRLERIMEELPRQHILVFRRH
jgi:ubiquinone/menaquinone biosynthesis C-methylase UbiE